MKNSGLLVLVAFCLKISGFFCFFYSFPTIFNEPLQCKIYNYISCTNKLL